MLMPTIHVKVHERLFFVNNDKFNDAISRLEKGDDDEDVRKYLESNKEISPIKDTGIGHYDFDSIHNRAPDVIGNYYRNSPQGIRLRGKHDGKDYRSRPF